MCPLQTNKTNKYKKEVHDEILNINVFWICLLKLVDGVPTKRNWPVGVAYADIQVVL